MKPDVPSISKEKILASLRYEPSSGALIRVAARNSAWIGSVAGTIIAGGYRSINISGKRYYAHRIVWFLHHGEWPSCDIDHIDRDRDNNRIGNLRLASRSQNNVNSKIPRNNTSGFKGVWWEKRRKRWVAEVHAGGNRKIHVGTFLSLEVAAAAYADVAKRLHGDFYAS